mmetsp:Transcript_6107/g.8961  ORF Transcript_6107/g.8961 Transcript_6107/m.8961 type:complete len:149 (-) Transcript_6107:2097-2543(-)
MNSHDSKGVVGTPDTTASSDCDSINMAASITTSSSPEIMKRSDSSDDDDASILSDASSNASNKNEAAETPAGFQTGEATISASAVRNMLDDIDRILQEEDQQEEEVTVSKLFSQVGSARSMALVRRPSGLMRSRNLLKELNSTVLVEK